MRPPACDPARIEACPTPAWQEAAGGVRAAGVGGEVAGRKARMPPGGDVSSRIGGCRRQAGSWDRGSFLARRLLRQLTCNIVRQRP